MRKALLALHAIPTLGLLACEQPPQQEAPPAPSVSVLAGSTATGFADGVAHQARFSGPTGIALSPDGAHLFVADTFTGLLRRLDTGTAKVETIVGRPYELTAKDGPAGEARLAEPRGLAVSPDGASIYVGDGRCVRRVDAATHAVETIVGDCDADGSQDGVGEAARFSFLLHDLEIDDAGAALYVADRGNDAVRRVELQTGEVTTLAGGLAGPGGLALDGDTLYVAETFAGRIVSLDVSAGSDGATTVVSADPLLDDPQGIVLLDGALYSTSFSGAIVRVDPSTGAASIAVGARAAAFARDGEGDRARLGGAFAPPARNGRGGLFYVDLDGDSIRDVDPVTPSVKTVAGPLAPRGFQDGEGDRARFRTIYDVKAHDGRLLVADTENHVVRRVEVGEDGAPAVVSTLSGAGGLEGADDGALEQARFRYPVGLAVDEAGGRVFVADAGNHALRAIDLARGEVTTLAGRAGEPGAVDGAGAEARFADPWHLAYDAQADALYVADSGNSAVRRVSLGTGEVTTLAGALGQPGHVDGPADAARFRLPVGLALSDDGRLFVSDFEAHTLRAIDLASGQVSTLSGEDGFAGIGEGPLATALYDGPSGLSFDAAARALYVADNGNHVVTRVDLVADEAVYFVGRVGRGGGIPSGVDVPLAEATLILPESAAVLDGAVAIVNEGAVLLVRP